MHPTRVRSARPALSGQARSWRPPSWQALSCLLVLPGLLACGDKDESTDNDGDGVFASSDCDDAEPRVGGPTSWRPDVDGDGFGSDRLELAIEACEAPSGFTSDDSDCDDTDPAVNPTGEEVCDGLDNDCDGLLDDADDSLDRGTMQTFYRDADGDGYGEDVATKEACSQPEGYAAEAGDCDDTDDDASPETEWYLDRDGDGYGDPYAVVTGCERPEDGSPRDTDCNDGDADISPEGQEICNGLDDDCDGLVDDEDTEDVDVETGTAFYEDADGDGYGDAWGTPVWSCEAPSGYLDDASDCDDSTTLASPAGTEVCGDGLDNDCSGSLGACGIDGPLGQGDADAVVVGASSLDFVGYAASLAPDLDGDGLDDLLIGAYGVDTGGSSAGAAYVQVGGSLSGTIDAGDLPHLVGTADSDYLGRELGGLGDVDGDGLGDWAVGAYGDDTNGSLAGAIVFLSGLDELGSGGVALADLGGPDWIGDTAGDYLGYGVSGGGDLDGDGLADVALGAKYANDDTGTVYLFYGSTSFGGDGGTIGAAADATVVGASKSDYVGEKGSTRIVEDLDGDGLAELVIGAYGEDAGINGGGMTGVILGSGTRLSGETELPDADWRLEGTTESGFLGFAHAGLGDLDADGYGDLVTGAFAGNEGDGVAWLVYGGAGTWSGAHDDEDADAAFLGPVGASYFGRTLASGDIDGDGHPDLAVGGHGYDDGSLEDAGRVWVLFGESGWQGSYDADAEAEVTITGEDSKAYVGWALSSGGDVDGDGADELLVGAYRSDGPDGRTQAGQVLLFYGGGH